MRWPVASTMCWKPSSGRNSFFGEATRPQGRPQFGKRKWLVAVYRELSRHDGFVITDYLLDTRPKGKIAWRRP